jgi:hypothetical protein
VSAVVGRAPLVLSLALATLGRLAGRTPAALPTTRQTGRIVTVVAGDGALLVDTERGPVRLIVAWDATIRGADDVIALEDVRVGDVVEWSDDTGQAVAMVDTLRILPAVSR